MKNIVKDNKQFIEEFFKGTAVDDEARIRHRFVMTHNALEKLHDIVEHHFKSNGNHTITLTKDFFNNLFDY